MHLVCFFTFRKDSYFTDGKIESFMPQIFDNIDQQLLPVLQQSLDLSTHSDFCVGYFNLRGWKSLDSYVEKWSGGSGNCCRLLVGMNRLPSEELQEALSLDKQGRMDNETAIRLKKKLAEHFKDQLTYGTPTNEDEEGLKRLAKQIKSNKVIVREGETSLLEADTLVTQKAAKTAVGRTFFNLRISLSQDIKKPSSSDGRTCLILEST